METYHKKCTFCIKNISYKEQDFIQWEGSVQSLLQYAGDLYVLLFFCVSAVFYPLHNAKRSRSSHLIAASFFFYIKCCICESGYNLTGNISLYQRIFIQRTSWKCCV